jgi:hypothetical protein
MGRKGDGNTDRRKRGRTVASSPADDEPPTRGWLQSAESGPDGDFAVRRVTGSASGKTYRCPGCDQEISGATPHIVAWPVDRVDDRRHWHTTCWSKRLHRMPTVQRSRNAPRL